MQSYSWILLALCLFIGASYQYVNYSSFTRTIYTTTMTPDQVIPEPFNNDGFGAVVCEYDRNVKQLDCTVQHGGMPDVFAVAIRHADRRQNGPIVYSFTQPTGHSPFPSNFRELFQLEDQSDYPAFQQELDFLNGLWYIEMYTEKPELDSIRGQLEHVDSLFAILTVDETFPPAWGSPSRGIALASYTRFNPLRQADFDVVHNVVNPTWAETGHGKLKTPGENVFTFKSPDSPIIENYQYTIGEERELLKDRQFVQVGSDLNPQGEIRGQLLRVDPIPEISFTGRMDSAQLGPSGKSFARGCILVAYDCDSRLMEYLVFHDVNQATRAIAQVGPPGSTGPTAFELAGAESPIFGTRVLSQTEEFFLLSQQMYIVVESLRYPEGEIRGQISAQYEFYAYLSGTQVVPPLSTAAVGCATFTLEQARVLDYELLHDVPLATATELRNGVVGESGPVTVEFRSPSRLLYGVDVTLDDDDLSDLYLNRLYVEVRSEENPAGEVRGQVLRIKPCNAEHQDLPYDTGVNPLKLPITYSGGLSGEAFFSLGLLLLCLLVAFQLPN